MYEVSLSYAFARFEAVAFEDLSSNPPYTALAVKPPGWLNCYHPSHSPDDESTKQIEWNLPDKTSRIGLDSVYTNIGTAFVEPPIKVIFLFESFVGNRVVDDGRGFVAKQLAAV